MVLSIIEQAEARGKAEAKAEAIITLLNHKFKEVNPKVENKLKYCTDVSVLDNLLVFVLKASSMTSFSRKVSSLLGPLKN
jgi:hypothetical protein